MSTTTSEISGNKQQQGNYDKYVGYAVCKVLALNPSMDELNELLGTDKVEKEPEYTGEKDGVATAKIDVWLEDQKSKHKFKLGFFIMDKEVESERTGKTEYINSVGASSWAKEEDDLPEYFTNFTKKDSNESLGAKSVRKALVGEDKFYKFLRSWLSLDYFHPDTKLVVSKQKLLAGDMSDLNALIKTDIAESVIVEATVRTVGGEDGEVKEYQNIYNNAFLPGSYIKHLRITSDPEKKPALVKSFIKDVTDSEFGCKDFYYMGDLKKYDSSDNLAASTAVISEENSDY